MTDKEVDAVISDIWAGVITEYALPDTLFEYLFYELFNPTMKSYKQAAKKLAEAQVAYTEQVYRQSLGQFSAAKTYNQVKDMTMFLFDSEGVKTPLSKFKEAAKEVFGLYNKTYLKVEQDTAVRVANARAYWGEIEATKDVFPYLKYQTVNDARVRPDHKQLDGIIRKVDDKFWNTYFPPNDWNCRCRVIQLDEGRNTPLPKLEKLSPDFAFNPGKVDYVFSDKHPYFERAPKDLIETNFGLTIPEK